MSVMTYAQAALTALRQEMERDPLVWVLGEDLGPEGGVAGQYLGLQQLFGSIGVSPDVAQRIAEGMRDALAQPGTPNAPDNPPLMPQSVAQLTWLGIDNDAIQRMSPYVVLLPGATPVNVNTAPKEVLAAAIPNLDLGTAQHLVQLRQHAAFKDVAEAQAQVPNVPIDGRRANTRSSYFVVRGRLRLADHALEERSLVVRRGLDMVTLWRERVNSEEPGP